MLKNIILKKTKKLFENFLLPNYKKIEIDSRAGVFKKINDA